MSLPKQNQFVLESLCFIREVNINEKPNSLLKSLYAYSAPNRKIPSHATECFLLQNYNEMRTQPNRR